MINVCMYMCVGLKEMKRNEMKRRRQDHNFARNDIPARIERNRILHRENERLFERLHNDGQVPIK